MALKDIDVYRTIASLHGVKVIDNSFLRGYVGKDRNHGFLDSRSFELENTLYNIIERFTDELITFPEEMRFEFSYLSDGIISCVSALENSVKQSVLRSNIRYDEPYIIFQRMRSISMRRAYLLENILNKNSTENYLPSDKWESELLPSIIDITKRHKIKRWYKERRDSNLVKVKNKLNDPRIFSKALEVSRGNHVFLLTSDEDFIGIHKFFYEELDLLSEKHGFYVPDYAVCIVVRYRDNSLSIIEPLEKPKPLNEKELHHFYHKE